MSLSINIEISNETENNRVPWWVCLETKALILQDVQLMV